uniref:Uncharacterized protein n=1 Tax=Lactuca sativa TaxID=4236 RepID=A0A9R1X3S1_LACSA|nr:hypothetical protein LSAT_V11C700349950 [Lactuca sativa]
MIQKCTAALRQLAYNIVAEASDEYLKMSERTDVAHQVKHGFPVMLSSIDCTHWEWANCPNVWRGRFTRGDHGCRLLYWRRLFQMTYGFGMHTLVWRGQTMT